MELVTIMEEIVMDNLRNRSGFIFTFLLFYTCEIVICVLKLLLLYVLCNLCLPINRLSSSVDAYRF